MSDSSMEILRLIYDMLEDGQYFDWSEAPIPKQTDELRALYDASIQVLRAANRIERHLDSLKAERAVA